MFGRQIGQLLAGADLELLEPFGGHDAVRRAGESEDEVRGPPIRVQARLALASALCDDAVESAQPFDMMVDVEADPAGIHALGFQQRADRRVLVIDGRKVAFDFDELGHGLARDRFAFAELPVLDPAMRGVERVRTVMLQRLGHDIRAGAQVSAGEFGELLRDRRPGLPVVA